MSPCERPRRQRPKQRRQILYARVTKAKVIILEVEAGGVKKAVSSLISRVLDSSTLPLFVSSYLVVVRGDGDSNGDGDGVVMVLVMVGCLEWDLDFRDSVNMAAAHRAILRCLDVSSHRRNGPLQGISQKFVQSTGS